MTKIEVVNLKNEKVSDVTLSKEVFGIEPNTLSLKKAIRLQLDAVRQGSQKTKNRSEVSGGGRKPYRQKGTGNARQGSIRAPHYVGGGHVFALRPRNYTFDINRKERILALKSALSIKANEKNIIVIDSLAMNSLKTKDAIKLLTELKIADKKVLFVTSGDVENLYMATRNLNKVCISFADEVNVLDVTYADVVIFDSESLNFVEEVLK